MVSLGKNNAVDSIILAIVLKLPLNG